MIIERTAKEIIIRFPANTNIDELQHIINLLKYKRAIDNSKAQQEEVGLFFKEIKKGLWAKVSKKLLR